MANDKRPEECETCGYGGEDASLTKIVNNYFRADIHNPEVKWAWLCDVCINTTGWRMLNPHIDPTIAEVWRSQSLHTHYILDMLKQRGTK